MRYAILALAALLVLATPAWAQQAPTSSPSSVYPATGSEPPAATDQQQNATPSQPTGTTSDPAPTTATDPPATTGSSMPRTASPVPLVEVVGLLALAGGFWLAGDRRRA